MPVVVLPKCNILKFIYDYTTKYRMNMNLDTPIKLLVNQFLKDTVTYNENGVATNPCNINTGCFIPDDLCSLDTITLDACTLRISNLSISIFPAYLITPTFLGAVGAVTYLWGLPLNTLVNLILEVSSGGINSSTLLFNFVPPSFVGVYPVTATVKQTIQYINCNITDSIGCTATKQCAFVYNGNSSSLIYILDCTTLYPVTSLAISVISLTSTTVTIATTTPMGLYTYDVELWDSTHTFQLFGSRGQFLQSVGSYTITGLSSGITWQIDVIRYEANGTTTKANISFTTP